LVKSYNDINRCANEVETFVEAIYETSKIPVPSQQFRKHSSINKAKSL